MSLETFAERLRKRGDQLGIQPRVKHAALTDFMRLLHEIFVKLGRHQTRLLADVQASLGKSTALHLMSLIDASRLQSRISKTVYTENVSRAVETICAERGIGTRKGQELFREFLAAFNQERYEEDGSGISTTWLLYFGVSDEAAYHFGGLFTGDAGGEVSVAIEYLDWRLKRYSFLVRMWELEKAWDDEEAARDGTYESYADEEEQVDTCNDHRALGEFTLEKSKAIAIREKILDATVMALIEMPYDVRLSGEDSVLETIWEEICAQVQSEYSFYWDTYVEIMRTYLVGYLDQQSAEDKAELMAEDTEDEVIEDLMSGLLSRAADYECENVSRFNCWRTEDEYWK